MTSLGFLSALAASEVKRDEPLAPWCSIRVGGPAEALVRPASANSLATLLRLARDNEVPIALLGGGANTLIGDLGVAGITLKLNNDYFAEEITRAPSGETLVTLNAGAAITRLVTLMKTHQLTGAEFLAGIPGTIGGAVAMNAGTKNGECMTLVDALELATADGLGWVDAKTVSFHYRHTDLPVGSVVTRVRFRLTSGDLLASAQKMELDLAYRKSTQPLSQPNFGSVFTNPPAHFAGALIEKSGLKGRQIGSAQISTKHANWVVNLGGAKAFDVTRLMAEAQSRVLEDSGVALVPEVKRIGSFT